MLFVIYQNIRFIRTKQILRSRCNHYLREEEDTKKKRRRKSLIRHLTTASVTAPPPPPSPLQTTRQSNKENDRHRLITHVILPKTYNYSSLSLSLLLLLLFHSLIIILISSLLPSSSYNIPLQLALCQQLRQQHPTTSSRIPIVPPNGNIHKILNGATTHIYKHNSTPDPLWSAPPTTNNYDYQQLPTSTASLAHTTTKGRYFSGNDSITLVPDKDVRQATHVRQGMANGLHNGPQQTTVSSNQIRQRIEPTMKVAGSLTVGAQRYRSDELPTTTQVPRRVPMSQSNNNGQQIKQQQVSTSTTKSIEGQTTTRQQQVHQTTIPQQQQQQQQATRSAPMNQPRVSSSFYVSANNRPTFALNNDSHKDQMTDLNADQLDSSSSVSTISQTVRLTGSKNRQKLINQHSINNKSTLSWPSTPGSVDDGGEFESGASESSSITERTASSLFPTNSVINGSRGAQLEGATTVTTTLDELESQIVTNKTTAQLTCDTGEMILKLNFSEPYKGITYPDYNRLSPCKFYGDGQRYYEIHLPLKGCGTIQAAPRIFMNNVIVRFHRSLEFEEDEIKTIICRYPPPLAPPPTKITLRPTDDVTTISSIRNNDQQQPFDIIDLMQENGNKGSTGVRKSGNLVDPILLDNIGETLPGLTRDLDINNNNQRTFLDNLTSYELLFIISSILFLSLLILALASGWYCMRRRQQNLVILKRKRRYLSPASLTPSSPGGSDLSGVSITGQKRGAPGTPTTNAPIVIPRAVAGNTLSNSGDHYQQHLLQYGKDVTADWPTTDVAAIHRYGQVGTLPPSLQHHHHHQKIATQQVVGRRAAGNDGVQRSTYRQQGYYNNYGYQYHTDDDLSANNNNIIRSAKSHNELYHDFANYNNKDNNNLLIDNNTIKAHYNHQHHRQRHQSDNLNNLLAIPYTSASLINTSKGGTKKRRSTVKYINDAQYGLARDGRFPRRSQDHNQSFIDLNQLRPHQRLSRAKSLSALEQHQMMVNNGQHYHNINDSNDHFIIQPTNKPTTRDSYYGISRYAEPPPTQQVKHYLFDEEEEEQGQNRERQGHQYHHQHHHHHHQSKLYNKPGVSASKSQSNNKSATQTGMTKSRPKITIKNIEDSYITINHEIETNEYMMREQQQQQQQQCYINNDNKDTVKQAPLPPPPPPPVRSSNYANDSNLLSSASSSASDQLAGQMSGDAAKVPLIGTSNSRKLTSTVNDSAQATGKPSILAEGGAITDGNSSDGVTGSSTIISSSSLLGASPKTNKSNKQKIILDDMRSLTELNVDFARSMVPARNPATVFSSEFQPNTSNFQGRTLLDQTNTSSSKQDFSRDKVPSLIGVLEEDAHNQIETASVSKQPTLDATTSKTKKTTTSRANEQQVETSKLNRAERPQSPDFVLSPDYDYNRLEFEPSSRNSVSYV